MILNPPKNQKKKDHSFLNTNPNTIPHKKNSAFSTTLSINNTKNMANEETKKDITAIDFIKNKKKFIIHDLFDKNGTKNFLASRDLAMMKIQLDDEILDKDIEENKNKYDTKLTSNSIKNEKKEKNKRNKKRNSTLTPENRKIINDKKNDNKIPIPKKRKKSNYRSSIKNNTNMFNNNNNNNNIYIIDQINNDSKGSDFFYKFIINNANESENNFNKKLEKALQRVETQKQKNKKENINKSGSHKGKENNDRPRNFNSVKTNKKKGSIFNFSETAKILMTNDGIDASSISSYNDNHNKNKPKRFSVQNNINRNKIQLDEKEIEIVNNKKSNSLISILDELM